MSKCDNKNLYLIGSPTLQYTLGPGSEVCNNSRFPEHASNAAEGYPAFKRYREHWILNGCSVRPFKVYLSIEDHFQTLALQSYQRVWLSVSKRLLSKSKMWPCRTHRQNFRLPKRAGYVASEWTADVSVWKCGDSKWALNANEKHVPDILQHRSVLFCSLCAV
jgi:hypothetical protein